MQKTQENEFQKINPRSIKLFKLEAFGILAIVFFILSLPFVAAAIDNAGITGAVISLIVYILILIPAYILSSIWARHFYNNFRYKIGERKIIIYQGVIWRQKTYIPYDRIQNIDITEGPIERYLGLSTLVIETAGRLAPEGWIPGIPPKEAENLKKLILSKVTKSSSL